MSKRPDKTRKHRDSLADFFAASPLRNSGLVLERDKCPPRAIDFDDGSSSEGPKVGETE
jgi:hypothetical protein